jgi:hypothetical protein
VVEVYSKELHIGDKLVKVATDEIRDGQPVNDKPAKKGEKEEEE